MSLPTSRHSPAPSATDAPIYVTRPFLPPRAAVDELLDGIWERGWVTNGGPLARQLTDRLRDALGVERFLWCTNGTVTLELALKALGITGSVITTPLTYVATANAILNVGLTPVFADVDPRTCALDPAALAAALRPDTTAIMPVHVYGYPCDIAGVEAFAEAHGLRVIYDGAQAFGSRYRDRPLATYGDAASYSFHATKVYNTVEGGGLALRDAAAHERAFLHQTHGHRDDVYVQVGTNAKNTEFHAAIGLLNLDAHAANVAARAAIFDAYAAAFRNGGARLLDLRDDPHVAFNYAYAPLVFGTEDGLLAAKSALEAAGIYSRRYFWPTLTDMPQFAEAIDTCPVAADLARRLLCLPIYPGLANTDVERVVRIVASSLAA